MTEPDPTFPDPMLPPEQVDAPTSAHFSEAHVWPSWMPFGKTWEPLLQLVFEVAVLMLVGVLVIAVVVASVRTVQRRRVRRHIEDEASKVSGELARELSVRKGLETARKALLDDIRNQWSKTPHILDAVIDQDIVRESADAILRGWEPHRIREFCLRYERPLKVILSAQMSETFTTADLTIPSGRYRTYPTLVGLGENPTGMYAMYYCDEYLLIPDWEAAIPVLAAALDAPDLRVSETEGRIFCLELNDANLRAESTDIPVKSKPSSVVLPAADNKDTDTEVLEASKKHSPSAHDHASDDLSFEEAFGEFNKLHGYGEQGRDIEFDSKKLTEFVGKLIDSDGALDTVRDAAQESGFCVPEGKDIGEPVSADSIKSGDLIISSDDEVLVYIGDGDVLGAGGSIARIEDSLNGAHASFGVFRLVETDSN